MEWPSTGPVGLHAEFYQLMLAAVYHADGLWGEATFDLYARELPVHHGYLVAAGLEAAIEGVLGLGFDDAAIAWMRAHPSFAGASASWWDSVANMRFSGDVYAAPEGTILFPDEPILRISAPLIQASLLETRLIQLISFASGMATRASRLVEAADGRDVLDFGSRRMATPEAALLGARAAYVGGCAATTCTLAGAAWDVPLMATLSGTFMAAYGDDETALDAFSIHFPDQGYVMLPEGDPVGGVRRLLARNQPIKIVRVDHRDLVSASRIVRRALDDAGQQEVKILGSGSLDESRLTRLARSGAPVDLVAVGRNLAIPQGAPGNSMVYRLAELWKGPDPEPVTRPGASRYPGCKQVVRTDVRDVICLEHEAFALEQAGGRSLMEPVILQGERVRAPEHPRVARDRRAAELDALPTGVRELQLPDVWPVRVSDELARLSLG